MGNNQPVVESRRGESWPWRRPSPESNEPALSRLESLQPITRSYSENSRKHHGQSKHYVYAGRRHRRVRHPRQQRLARRIAENRPGTERVLSAGLHASDVARRKLPYAAREGRPRRHQRPLSDRLLQYEAARFALRHAGGKTI